jgi:hypothetical protein
LYLYSNVFLFIIQMQDGSIEIIDLNLKRQVTLTTPDLRFAENIVRQVTADSSGGGADGDNFLDGVGWDLGIAPRGLFFRSPGNGESPISGEFPGDPRGILVNK